MACALGPKKCIALSFLHAFSECNTVSSFCWLWKKDCVGNLEDIWWDHTSILHLSSNSRSQIYWWFPLGNGAVCSSPVQLYTSTEMKVNETWKQLFSQKGRPMDYLPHTWAAILEHSKRAVYEAGLVWVGTNFCRCSQCTISCWIGEAANNQWRIGSEVDSTSWGFSIEFWTA